MLPYENTSGQVYVQLYVFCDKNDIPKELEAAAQEFFEETGVELRWTNLYNYASNKPNIVSEDFKQLEVPQVNDISNIINRNLPVFSKHRNITAIQPSLKVTNSKQTNDPCIRVYVLGKRYLPVGESEIPNAVENYPVDIVNGFWLEASDTRKPLMAHKQGEYLRLGASIGVRGKNSAGTLGAIVKDDGGTFYLLSCDHVMRDEREGQIIHPGKCHYRNSLEYHLLGYHNWINRIFNQQDIFQDNHRDPAEYFRQLESKVDSFYSGKYRHPKLRECERKLRKLISEPPRTVAHFIDGIRENVGEERYIDVAVAKLTNEEIEALKRNGYVEIIDTTDYPDGNVTWDGSVSVREWRKSGSTSGYTSLKNRVLVDNVYLKHSASGNPSSMLGSSVYAERVMSDAVWCKKCMILSRIDDSFAGLGDSGTVIFEKSEPQPQAMPGFGIIIGFLFDKDDRCVETIAIPLGIALHHLSEKLRSRLTLVSAL